MPKPLKNIRWRIAEVRKSEDFAYATRLNSALDALETEYGLEGKDAARVLRRMKDLSRAIDTAAIKYLVPLRLRSRKTDVHATGMKRKIQVARSNWRTAAFDVRQKTSKPGPDATSLRCHPACIPETSGKRSFAFQLANATASELAMDLAEAYDEQRKASRYTNESRSLELDDIISAFGDELTDFAKIVAPADLEKHRDIARAYRRYENIAEAVSGEALVVRGIEAFKLLGEEDDGTIQTVESVNGASVSASSVRDYIRAIGKLPAFGSWDRKKLPSEAVALARAVQGLGYEGITFTVNLHVFNASRFRGSKRAQASGMKSAIQDQLYKALNKAFGGPVDFYFVLEQGVDEAPHLHGAVALDATPENMKTVKRCLKQLAQADQKRKAPERLVKVDRLTTPGRWGGYAVKASMVSSLRADIRNTISKTQGLK